jgi:hypothetical protein
MLNADLLARNNMGLGESVFVVAGGKGCKGIQNYRPALTKPEDAIKVEDTSKRNTKGAGARILLKTFPSEKADRTRHDKKKDLTKEEGATVTL